MKTSTGGREARFSNWSFLCLAALFANSLACVPSVRGASQFVKPPCQTQKILCYWYGGWLIVFIFGCNSIANTKYKKDSEKTMFLFWMYYENCAIIRIGLSIV